MTIINCEQKALSINLNNIIYGTFAEIGAGQEVARQLFGVGGASRTIAKTISAYDMAVSDAVYGKSDRYVCEDRLRTMLKKEFEQLHKRLHKERGRTTSFFSFANTVATSGYGNTNSGHGWVGVYFQARPESSISRVIIHITMHDKTNQQQQEALGIVGINLLYSCYYYLDNRENFISSLMDSIANGRLNINMISIEGDAFKNVDSRLWNLELVKQDYSKAILFNDKGKIVNIKDFLYKKNILICRGSYRPPTLVNMDMIKMGEQIFAKSISKSSKIFTLPEISMNKLKQRGGVDNEDFLARVDILNSLGHYTLISNYQSFSALSKFLSLTSKGKLGFVFGYYNLDDIFGHSFSGELLDSIAGLISNGTQLFCYPASDNSGNILTIKEHIKDQVEKGHYTDILIDYLEKKEILKDIKKYNREVFHIWSRKVLEMIQTGKSGWEKMLPPAAITAVKNKKLFGYKD